MIERMSEQQLAAVMKIWLAGNLESHPFIDPQYWQDHFSAVKDAMRTATVYCFIDPEVKGFIGLQDNYVAGLFVAREFRGQGIGSKLLEFAKKDHQLLTLDAYRKNPAAIKFYQSHQFRIVDLTADEVRMMWQSQAK